MYVLKGQKSTVLSTVSLAKYQRIFIGSRRLEPARPCLSECAPILFVFDFNVYLLESTLESFPSGVYWASILNWVLCGCELCYSHRDWIVGTCPRGNCSQQILNICTHIPLCQLLALPPTTPPSSLSSHLLHGRPLCPLYFPTVDWFPSLR